MHLRVSYNAGNVNLLLSFRWVRTSGGNKNCVQMTVQKVSFKMRYNLFLEIWPKELDRLTVPYILCVYGSGPSRQEPGNMSTEQWLLHVWLSCRAQASKGNSNATWITLYNVHITTLDSQEMSVRDSGRVEDARLNQVPEMPCHHCNKLCYEVICCSSVSRYRICVISPWSRSRSLTRECRDWRMRWIHTWQSKWERWIPDIDIKML